MRHEDSLKWKQQFETWRDLDPWIISDIYKLGFNWSRSTPIAQWLATYNHYELCWKMFKSHQKNISDLTLASSSYQTFKKSFKSVSILLNFILHHIYIYNIYPLNFVSKLLFTSIFFPIYTDDCNSFLLKWIWNRKDKIKCLL